MAIHGPVVDTAGELRNLLPHQRAGAGAIRVLIDPMGDGSIDPSFYCHRPDRSDPESLPQIIAPTDNNGRWVQITAAGVGGAIDWSILVTSDGDVVVGPDGNVVTTS